MSTRAQAASGAVPGASAPADFSAALAQGFARRIGTLARRLGAAAESVRWAQRAAFAASRATTAGHVCVPLARLAHRYGAAPADVRAALFASGVVSHGAQAAPALRPLVIDEAGRLYLARYFDYERRLARALVAHAQAQAPHEPDDARDAASPDQLRERLARYFGPPHDAEVDWQRVAAVAALSGRLTIVSGGPGTGKTTTVVGVLACLLDAHAALRIALAAPTGKAAQRMQEALLARAGDLPAEVAARLPQTSYTLHRLLGSGPDGRFRHHRANPLPYDVIVVDEASMIDVAMAAHLFDALGPDTRLVMLGDKDQLAAVEAGAVFAELSARPAFSGPGMARVAHALGIDEAGLAAALPSATNADDARAAPALDDDAFFASAGEIDALAWLEEIDEIDEIDAADAARWSVADDERAATSRLDDERARVGASSAEPALAPEREPHATPLTDCVVWLERNYRFGLDSPIGRLSLAIRRGAVNVALGALALDPAEPCAAALYEDAGVRLAERTIARLAQGFAPYAQALGAALAERTPDPAPLFDALNRFRILCATRAGSRGVDQLNELMGAQVRRAARVALGVGASWFVGRPVMVARNDYALGLFNGDIGIALPGADGALRVFFRTADGGLRAVSPAALPPHDTAFALTVHKSQGSEFDHAVLVLPPAASRVLSRELVYTAVTRARLAVEVIGSAAVLRQAIATQTQRDSGLAARIAEALRDLQ
jgi:exodeoxyribonuclease V alpha subunit